MGKQILLHCLPEDMLVIYQHLRLNFPVSFTLRSDGHPDTVPIDDPSQETDDLIMWRPDILPFFRRYKVERPNGKSYFRVDEELPVLEIVPSHLIVWNGIKSLQQGCIYGLMGSRDNEPYVKWYESLTRWIRKNFAKNPLSQLGGYVGPAAFEWFRAGGVLLPIVLPVTATPEWMEFVNRQHSQ